MGVGGMDGELERIITTLSQAIPAIALLAYMYISERARAERWYDRWSALNRAYRELLRGMAGLPPAHDMDGNGDTNVGRQ